MYAGMVGKLGAEKSAKPPYFGAVSFTEHLYSTKQTSVVYKLLSKPKFFPGRLNNKFEKLCEGLIYPSYRLHNGVTFSELVHWLLKHMIIAETSK